MRKRTGILLVAWLCLFCRVAALGEWSTHVLTFFYWGDEALSQANQDVLSLFAGEYRFGIVTSSKTERQAYVSALSERLKAGDVDDLVLLDAEMLRLMTKGPGQQARFADIEQYLDIIDLTQFSYLGLEGCTVGRRLSAVPISVTSHLLFWNQSALKRVGLSLPGTTEQALAAGEVLFGTQGTYLLGADAQGRMALMVTYLQSRYGLSWVNPDAHQCGFSLEQVAEGMRYLRHLEESRVLAPFDPEEDVLAGWQGGRYAGLWVWDSLSSQVHAKAPQGDQIVHAAQLTDWGPYDGGFEKVLYMLAIPSGAKEPQMAASLIQFLLNTEPGAQIMADLLGTPDSKAGRSYASRAKVLDENRMEANETALSWPGRTMPMAFEAQVFMEKGGIYQQVLTGLSQGKLSPEAAAAAIVSGLKTWLGQEETTE